MCSYVDEQQAMGTRNCNGGMYRHLTHRVLFRDFSTIGLRPGVLFQTFNRKYYVDLIQ
jgi:hypothetical protein